MWTQASIILLNIAATMERVFFFLERNIISIDCNDCRLIDCDYDCNKCSHSLLYSMMKKRRDMRDIYTIILFLDYYSYQNRMHCINFVILRFLVSHSKWNAKIETNAPCSLLSIPNARCVYHFWWCLILLHISWKVITRAAVAGLLHYGTIKGVQSDSVWMQNMLPNTEKRIWKYLELFTTAHITCEIQTNPKWKSSKFSK